MRLAALFVVSATLLLVGSAGANDEVRAACVAARAYSTASPPTAGGPRGVPWMRAGRVVGYLYGYGETLQRLSPGRAALFAGGTGSKGEAMKVLWAARGGRSVVTVAGDRLHAPGSFLQSFSSVGVIGSGDWVYYASIVDLPEAGCWRLTIGPSRWRSRFALLAFDK